MQVSHLGDQIAVLKALLSVSLLHFIFWPLLLLVPVLGVTIRLLWEASFYKGILLFFKLECLLQKIVPVKDDFVNNFIVA